MKVLTLGTFDLFHRGHVELLKRCAHLGPVTVAINTDDFIRRYKHRPPTISYPGRLAVVQACRYVDRAIANNGRDQATLIRQEKPDLIVIGTDWHNRDYLAQIQIDTGFLVEHGISLMYVPYTDGVSTTKIREQLGAEADRRGDRNLLPQIREHAAPDPTAVQRLLA